MIVEIDKIDCEMLIDLEEMKLVYVNVGVGIGGDDDHHHHAIRNLERIKEYMAMLGQARKMTSSPLIVYIDHRPFLAMSFPLRECMRSVQISFEKHNPGVAFREPLSKRTEPSAN